MRNCFKLGLFLSVLGLLSCSIFIDPAPLEQKIFYSLLDGDVISLTSTGITKDRFVEFAEGRGHAGNKYKTIFRTNSGFFGDSSMVYLQPIYDNEPVIFDKYPLGMPIMIFNIGLLNNFYDLTSDKYRSFFDTSRHNPAKLGQAILMTNGFVEFADSSYSGYTILPIAPNSVGRDFDFRKVSFDLMYRDRNGNLKEFNKENLGG